MAPEKKPDLSIDWHACAFVDLLGQQAALDKFERMPLDSDLAHDADFIALVRQTYKKAQDLHNRVDTATRSFRDAVGRGVPPEQQLYWEKLTSYETRVIPFSDGSLIDVSLAIDHEILPAHGVASLIAIAANLMIMQLASGSPIRGGLEVGHAANVAPGVLYGPAVSRAYAIEHAVAQYPRVVVGNNLIAYLSSCEKMTADAARELPSISNPDLYASLCRSAASIAKRFMTVDIDGHVIVHFLSPYVIKILGVENARTLIAGMHKFVTDQCDLHRAERNTKLSFRYAQLVAYCRRSMPALTEIIGADWSLEM